MPILSGHLYSSSRLRSESQIRLLTVQPEADRSREIQCSQVRSTTTSMNLSVLESHILFLVLLFAQTALRLSNACLKMVQIPMTTIIWMNRRLNGLGQKHPTTRRLFSYFLIMVRRSNDNITIWYYWAVYSLFMVQNMRRLAVTCILWRLCLSIPDASQFVSKISI